MDRGQASFASRRQAQPAAPRSEAFFHSAAESSAESQQSIPFCRKVRKISHQLNNLFTVMYCQWELIAEDSHPQRSDAEALLELRATFNQAAELVRMLSASCAEPTAPSTPDAKQPARESDD